MSQRNRLLAGTMLDVYRVRRLIGSGGFSLIYLAEDEDSLDEVAIKEYIPKRYGFRNDRNRIEISSPEHFENFHRGRKLFYQEAMALAKLRHPNIVNVRNFFLENNTGYMVMDFEPGKNLARYIKKREGNLSTNFILTVFPPLLDALDLVHYYNHLHLDIKPGNIHLRAGGNPLLLDFGAVHELNNNRGEQKAQVITPGFSPIEQYYTSGKVGPWSDVYAIGASMRACIEGKSPPAATKRHANETMKPAADLFRKKYPSWLLEAIDWAMEIDPKRRPQSANDLREALVSGKMEASATFFNHASSLYKK